MAVIAEELIADLVVRDGKLKAGLSSAESTYRRGIGNMQRDTERFGRESERSFGLIKTGLAGLAAYLTTGAIIGGAREFLRLADSAKQIEAQLRLATQQTGTFAQATQDVQRIAMETRSGLSETAGLYANFARNAQELGISQQEAARATETVTKAFRISGATAAEAAGGLRQFLQGVQSGTLRGEELNSVLENAPRLARLLADSLGVTIGQLRAMGAEGELSADKLTAALTDRRFTEAIDAEFKELPVTFSEAMQQVENAATITFGAFDRGGQFSTAIATFVQDSASGFADMESAAESLGRTIGVELRVAGSSVSSLASEITALIGRMQDAANEAPAFANAFKTALAQVANAALPGLAPIAKTYLQATANTRLREARNLQADRNDQAVRDLFNGYDVLGNRQGANRPAGGGASASGAAAANKAAQAAAKAAREREAAERQAEQARRQAIRDEASSAAERARIEDDIISARKAIAIAETDLIAFQRQQIDREIEQRLENYRVEVRLGDLTQQEFDERSAQLEKLRQLRQQAVTDAQEEAARRQAQMQRENAARDEIDTAVVESQLAVTREERLTAEKRILALLYKEEEASIRAAAARGEIADLEEALANMRRRQSAEEQTATKRNQGAIGGWLDDRADPRSRAEEAVVRKLDAVNQGITDALADQLGVKDQFIKELFSIFLDDVVFKPLFEALGNSQGGVGGLLGSVLGSIGGLFGGARAGGGSVQAGRVYRVNEGQQEFFSPATNGTVVPLSQMNAAPAGGGGGQPVVVQLSVAAGEAFVPMVEAISGNVSVRTVQAAAPELVGAAVTETSRRLSRTRM